MIFKAIEFAIKAHGGQFRKGTNIPYIIHPLGTAKTLINLGCSEKLIVAAILHDIIEDTPVTKKDIEKTFGKEIASLVEEVTEPDRSDTWENRKRHTIEHLKTADMDVLLIACADKLDNIMMTKEEYAKAGEAVWARFNQPREYQQWYFRELADVFMSRIKGEPDATLFKRFLREVVNVFG